METQLRGPQGRPARRLSHRHFVGARRPRLHLSLYLRFASSLWPGWPSAAARTRYGVGNSGYAWIGRSV